MYMFVCLIVSVYVFVLHCDHRDLHVPTHSFPTRRSSDLSCESSRDDGRSPRAPARPGVRVGPWTAAPPPRRRCRCGRSEEHTSELQSLMRISYAVFCLKKQKRLDRLISIINS